ncbi:MAG: flagellar hook protein FlgE [Solirubrobacterales bacterium]
MLWGAMNNSVTGMMASSHDMGTISQNIANVNTVGYKRTETMFSTLLSEGHASPAAPSNLSIFGVQAWDRTHVQAQGVVTPTYHWSDLAISGRGFFMVAPPTANGGLPTNPSLTDPNAVYYTRAGTFNQVTQRTGAANEDARDLPSYFVTGSGQYLLGYMADANGAITSTQLEPIYTRPATVMPGRATTTASVSGNLPGNSATSGTAYSETLDVQDPNGATKTLTVDWTRTDGNTWVASVSGLAASDGTAAPVTCTLDAYGNLTPTSATITWDPVTYPPASPPTPNTSTLSLSGVQPPAPTLEKYPITVYDNLANGHTLNLGFEHAGTNSWYLHMPGATSEPIRLDYNSDGKLLTPMPANITASWTSTDNTTTPPTTTVTTSTFAIDLSKLTQYEGEKYVGTVDQDGFGPGKLRLASFDEKGNLYGSFDNGETQILAKVPLATFVSEDSLAAVSGTMFARTTGAGAITVSDVEDVPGGQTSLSPSSVENSTIDIEDEFTKMIMTQKAYSTNATVFKTADEMTTTVRDLKS